MKVFQTSQVRTLDRLTIEGEPISSIDLMERAAYGLFGWVAAKYSSFTPVYIFAGPGNNGGDGAALARMLCEVGFDVRLFVLGSSAGLSADLEANIQRLAQQGLAPIKYIHQGDDFPFIPSHSVAIDALFGSGLTRPIEGIAAHLINHINSSGATVVSIDLPSGLHGEGIHNSGKYPVVRANFTLALQFPKLCFFFPENEEYVGQWGVIPIGLLAKAIEATATPYMYVDSELANQWLPTRTRFQHKGNFGHCLLVAGSRGMMGAAVLSARGCLAAGAGLLTVHAPECGYPVLQSSVPEAMLSVDPSMNFFSSPPDTKRYTAIGVGPGLGQECDTHRALKHLLAQVHCPLVLDADALNILAQSPELLQKLPPNTVLTPHPGEFRRLFGSSNSTMSEMLLAIAQSNRFNVVIVLKGAYTKTVCPDGTVYINSTGNPGMATGGSGDALTGIITSLLGQGIEPFRAAALGVYLHGLAADRVADMKGKQSLRTSEIIDRLGEPF